MIVRGCSETLAGDGYCDACDGRRRKANTVTPLTVVVADIATLEAARDALPSHSHIAALLSLTLYRLEEEADAMRRVALKSAASPDRRVRGLGIHPRRAHRANRGALGL